jgi:hypothetical protein
MIEAFQFAMDSLDAAVRQMLRIGYFDYNRDLQIKLVKNINNFLNTQNIFTIKRFFSSCGPHLSLHGTLPKSQIQ